jgi:signal transduction histidine kinase
VPARTHPPAEPNGFPGGALRSAERRRGRDSSEDAPRSVEGRPGLGIRWAVDVPVAAIYGVPLIIVRVVQVVQGAPDITPLHIVTAALSMVALLFRRPFPVQVLVAVTLLTTVVTFSVDANNDLFAIPIALYAVAAFRSPRLAWLLAVGTILVTVGGLLLHREELDPRLAAADFATSLLLVLATYVVAILLGTLVGSRRERIRALEERAEQLARERDNQATIATLAERSRIAREMHDIVAHSVSVMVALADGAAVAVERNPQSAKRALEELAETGRSALSDMRRLLGVLGEGSSDELRPAPSRRDLPDLVARFRAAGLPVQLSESGQPVADATLELALYRLVQEALTNALRYAVDATLVAVDVDYRPDSINLTVTDDGRTVGGPAESVGAARGIIGMQERAAVHHGTAESGPRPGGGWRVRAVLPLSPAASTAPATEGSGDG